MAVFRIEKTNNYTIMSNYHLKDKNISHKARGLLSYMLCLPDDWDYSLSGLVKVSKESKSALRSALNELKENGYLIIEKIYPDKSESGRIQYIYNIYEYPKKKQDTENQYLEFQYLENRTQLNTNILKDKIDKSNESINHNVFTLELIKKEYIDNNEDEYVLCCYDNLFNSLLEYNSYQDISMIIYYILKRIKINEYKDENGDLIINRFGYLKNAINKNIKKLKLIDEEVW
ncbi:MAG: hypothetical protein E7174_03895 [Firmicutes bacterium]|nr:hypothetical protein [Bacillota bacterium]